MLTLDHLVILVDDLHQAVTDYTALGFTVTPGGTHADGLTHNALVVFADGTYLELIAFVDPADTRDNVWGWRQFAATGGGLIDYCAASPDLAKETERLRERGLVVSTPSDGGRQRPDGTQLRWRSARFDQAHRVLPFLIEDVTPRALRVPADHTTHPNGVTGIRQLNIIGRDLERITGELAVLTGSTIGPETYPVPGTVSRQFSLGKHLIWLTTPQNSHSPFHGASSGSFSLTLTTSQQPSDEWLDLQQTHGVRVRLMA
jgi:hypothetical protein